MFTSKPVPTCLLRSVDRGTVPFKFVVSLVASAGLALLGIGLLPSLAVAQHDSVPYEAVIHERTASVFSGPGDVHYVTDRLAIGRRVEVYRIDPDGWLAIRPPRGSFSLVPANVVTRTEEPGIGRIIVDDVKAWVGTRLDSPAQPLWQVRLKKDERVIVIGEQPPSQNPSDVKWVRIEPPAGEFRWVRAADVTRYIPADVSSHEGPFRETTSPNQTAVADADAAAPDVQLTSGEQRTQAAVQINDEGVANAESLSAGDTRPGVPGRLAPDLPSTSVPIGQPTPTTADAIATDPQTASENLIDAETSRNADGPEPDGFVKRPPANDASSESATAAAPTSDEANPSESLTADASTSLVELTNPAGQTIQLTFADAVRNLELQMTRMATYPVEKWDTRGLHFLVKQLMEQTQSNDEQARVQQMHQKLEDYDELHSKRIALSQMMTDAKPIGTGVDADNPIYQQSLDTEDPEAAEEARQALESYAGTGYLNRLITEHGLGKGGYVLQDKDGRIEFIVVPAPGVNLERYLSKQIAIQGGITPSRQFNKPLITADRVIQLDRFR